MTKFIPAPALRPARASGVMAPMIVGALVCLMLVAGWHYLRWNWTPSMPKGLWAVWPGRVELMHGDVVILCLPGEEASMAAARGYIGAGECRDGSMSLMKPVAAVPGDTVTVTPAGVAVNGRQVQNSAPLPADPSGRPLPAIEPGVYQVGPGTAWVISGHDPLSFDSRYFGAVPLSAVIGTAHPLFTEQGE